MILIGRKNILRAAREVAEFYGKPVTTDRQNDTTYLYVGRVYVGVLFGPFLESARCIDNRRELRQPPARWPMSKKHIARLVAGAWAAGAYR